MLDVLRYRWPLLTTLGQAVYAYEVRHSLPEAGFWVLITCLLLIAWEIRDLRVALRSGGKL